MTDIIRISGIRTTGYHGVFAHEREHAQEFVVDVSIHAETSAAARADELAHTVDYAAVAAEVVAIVAGDPVNLIETLAELIARRVLAHDFVAAVEITVHKPHADLGVTVDDVSVTIFRERITHV